MSNPVESLRNSKGYSLRSPRLLKALAIIWDTIIRRSAVDWEKIKKTSEERSHLSRWPTSLLVLQNHHKNTIRTRCLWLIKVGFDLLNQLSSKEDITSGPLNRGSKADLNLMRTLLPICQKLPEPRFLEVMDSFALLS